MVGFTRSLWWIKKEANININTLCPAFIDTDLVRKALSFGENRPVKVGEIVDAGTASPVEKCGEAFM